MNKSNNDQVVMENGKGARVEVNINTNETKKKRGFKRGAVVGTIGGIFLGGAGAAYAAHNGITMEDIENGINDFMDDVNRGIDAATNSEQANNQAEVNETVATATEEQAADVKEPISAEQETDAIGNEVNGEEEDERLSAEQVANAIGDEVNGEEEDERLSAEQVANAIGDEVNGEEEDERLSAEQVANAIGDEVNGEGVDIDDTLVPDEDALAVAVGEFDEMSFDEAFADAREQVGAGGVFEWRGGLYGTFYAEEWRQLPDDEKVEYTQDVNELMADYEFDSDYEEAEIPTDNVEIVDPMDIESVPESEVEVEQEPEVEIEVEQESVPEPEMEPEVDIEPEIEVEVDNTWNITDAEGNEVNVAHLTVDGESVTLVDTDGDGQMDQMLYDDNNDGIIDEADMFDIQDQNIMMDDLTAMVDDAETESFDCPDDFMA